MSQSKIHLGPEAKKHRCVCPHDCPDTCGMTVTVSDGRAIDMRGDKEHPFTKGFLCVKVNRYLERVYHPNRLRFPLKRVGRKGAGQFERISWEDAIKIIAERFQRIADSKMAPKRYFPTAMPARWDRFRATVWIAVSFIVWGPRYWIAPSVPLPVQLAAA